MARATGASSAKRNSTPRVTRRQTEWVRPYFTPGEVRLMVALLEGSSDMLDPALATVHIELQRWL